jgi:chaperone required for assembly of F1-ATPase
VGGGIRACEQDEVALANIAAAVRRADDRELTVLHLAVGALGSVVLALALTHGRLNADLAFAAAHVDELYQTEIWGMDHEAELRLERIRSDLRAAAHFMELARG